MKMFSRRQALSTSLSAVATMSAVGVSTKRAAAQMVPQTPLTAVVTLNGASYTFDEASGQDLGNFVSDIGGFTQRCVRSLVGGCPLTVFFRPDLNSDRVEVVFELGRLFTPILENLASYAVVISRGAQTLVNISVPAHYVFSRWRWQSSPRPVVADVAALIQQHLLPPYERAFTPLPPVAPETPAPPPPPPVETPPSPPVVEVPPSPPVVEIPPAPPPAAAPPAPPVTQSPPNMIEIPGVGWIDLNVIMQLVGNYNASAGQVVVAPPAPENTLMNTTALAAPVPSVVAPQPSPAPAPTPEPSPATARAAAALSVGTPQVYTIMGLAGVTAHMPTTGERADIGLLTEPQAQYVCTADAGALDTMRAQAEAAGTMPWHMRDENTGAPINFKTYPKASWYNGQTLGEPYVPTPKTPVELDSAHQPALAYVPYILTGDPYYLEELQFQATWNYGAFSVGYRPTLSQTRQFAWNMRTLGQCARITPASVPSWLLSQSYWAELMTAHRVFFETKYVNSGDLAQALFRATDNLDARPAEGNNPAGTWQQPWQSEFLATVLGWLITMGLSEWRTSFDWLIGGTVARTNNTSGWPRAESTPYQMILRASATAPIAQSWAEAWALNQNIGGLTFANGDTWTRPNDMTYLSYTRGALVYAQLLGTPLTDNLAWATNQLNAGGWKTAYKWRLGTGLN